MEYCPYFRQIKHLVCDLILKIPYELFPSLPLHTPFRYDNPSLVFLNIFITFIGYLWYWVTTRNYVCCCIIHIEKRPPGQKERIIKIFILINILVKFLLTHTKIINIWSSTVYISPPKWWVSIIDWNMIVGFQIITLWNMKLFFNNGNITKGYMTTT